MSTKHQDLVRGVEARFAIHFDVLRTDPAKRWQSWENVLEYARYIEGRRGLQLPGPSGYWMHVSGARRAWEAHLGL